MIKPMLFTLGLTLLAGNAFAVTADPQAKTAQTTPAALNVIARDAPTLATIDEDKAMAELLKG